ncbi:NUDIX hydrolase [Lentibacillus sediminis]|uniref:NUDIX hydrolase n=1 Tax=Lentibacillus sediminis TaxID=1940529 RepID=UPI000C1C43C5|nr:NUDIX hydrolase [Lentibacillus sediminis]
MEKWFGAAGICVNKNAQILMVLQGTPEESKKWAVPSGGKAEGETFRACCLREIEEETGYIAEIREDLKVKQALSNEHSISIEVHYFMVQLTGGEMKIQDPDELIYEIAWKSAEEIRNLELTYPEDREFLLGILKATNTF